MVHVSRSLIAKWIETLGIPATEDVVEDHWEALMDRIGETRFDLQQAYTQRWERENPGQKISDNNSEWMAMHERVHRQAMEMAIDEMFLEPIRIKRMQEMD